MPFEYKMLALMTLFFLLAFIPSSFAKAKTFGFKWVESNRDNKPNKQLPAWGERCERAHNNLKDNFPGFIVAILLLGLLNGFNDTTKTLALIYVSARVLHFLAYGFGRARLRSAAFLIGLICNAGLLLRVIDL